MKSLPDIEIKQLATRPGPERYLAFDELARRVRDNPSSWSHPERPWIWNALVCTRAPNVPRPPICPGPVQAIRKTPPPARRGFTRADQVNQLVGASEADPDLGFMARTMALCSLPRSNPRDRLRYVRRNGPYTLVMNAGGLYRLPFGHLPRLLMAWISTEAVRTQSRVLVLGDSLSDFMRELGIYSSDGKAYTRLRNQMDRLFHASVELSYEDKHGKQFIASRVVDRGDFWWDPKRPNGTVKLTDLAPNQRLGHSLSC